MTNAWNPSLYESSHSFVWQYGRDMLQLLSAGPGERILDVGSGTGQLTAEIAKSGADVTGIDQSEAMIEQARNNYPGIRFELLDVCRMEYAEEFDGVFSNAALHWVLKAESGVVAMARALKPGGRLVVEFGGRGNIRALLEAVRQAAEAVSLQPPDAVAGWNPWFFPGVAEYAGLLERHGMEVTFASLFDRLTQLDGGEAGLSNWMAMFGAPIMAHVPAEKRTDFMRMMEQFAAPALRRDGQWSADYRRLRIAARKLSGNYATHSRM